MRNRLVRLFAVLALFATAGAAPAFAQDRPFDFRIQIGRGVNTERLIQQAESHTSQLASMLEERDREGLASRVRQLESELNMADREFDRSSSYYDRRSSVANALDVANEINNVMRYRRVAWDVSRQWSLVRSDLNRLARALNLRQLY